METIAKIVGQAYNSGEPAFFVESDNTLAALATDHLRKYADFRAFTKRDIARARIQFCLAIEKLLPDRTLAELTQTNTSLNNIFSGLYFVNRTLPLDLASVRYVSGSKIMRFDPYQGITDSNRPTEQLRSLTYLFDRENYHLEKCIITAEDSTKWDVIAPSVFGPDVKVYAVEDTSAKEDTTAALKVMRIENPPDYCSDLVYTDEMSAVGWVKHNVHSWIVVHLGSIDTDNKITLTPVQKDVTVEPTFFARPGSSAASIVRVPCLKNTADNLSSVFSNPFQVTFGEVAVGDATRALLAKQETNITKILTDEEADVYPLALQISADVQWMNDFSVVDSGSQTALVKENKSLSDATSDFNRYHRPVFFLKEHEIQNIAYANGLSLLQLTSASDTVKLNALCNTPYISKLNRGLLSSYFTPTIKASVQATVKNAKQALENPELLKIHDSFSYNSINSAIVGVNCPFDRFVYAVYPPADANDKIAIAQVDNGGNNVDDDPRLVGVHDINVGDASRPIGQPMIVKSAWMSPSGTCIVLNLVDYSNTWIVFVYNMATRSIIARKNTSIRVDDNSKWFFADCAALSGTSVVVCFKDSSSDVQRERVRDLLTESEIDSKSEPRSSFPEKDPDAVVATGDSTFIMYSIPDDVKIVEWPDSSVINVDYAEEISKIFPLRKIHQAGACTDSKFWMLVSGVTSITATYSNYPDEKATWDNDTKKYKSTNFEVTCKHSPENEPNPKWILKGTWKYKNTSYEVKPIPDTTYTEKNSKVVGEDSSYQGWEQQGFFWSNYTAQAYIEVKYALLCVDTQNLSDSNVFDLGLRNNLTDENVPTAVFDSDVAFVKHNGTTTTYTPNGTTALSEVPEMRNNTTPSFSSAEDDKRLVYKGKKVEFKTLSWRVQDSSHREFVSLLATKKYGPIFDDDNATMPKSVIIMAGLVDEDETFFNTSTGTKLISKPDDDDGYETEPSDSSAVSLQDCLKDLCTCKKPFWQGAEGMLEVENVVRHAVRGFSKNEFDSFFSVLKGSQPLSDTESDKYAYIDLPLPPVQYDLFSYEELKIVAEALGLASVERAMFMPWTTYSSLESARGESSQIMCSFLARKNEDGVLLVDKDTVEWPVTGEPEKENRRLFSSSSAQGEMAVRNFKGTNEIAMYTAQNTCKIIGGFPSNAKRSLDIRQPKFIGWMLPSSDANNALFVSLDSNSSLKIGDIETINDVKIAALSVKGLHLAYVVASNNQITVMDIDGNKVTVDGNPGNWIAVAVTSLAVNVCIIAVYDSVNSHVHLWIVKDNTATKSEVVLKSTLLYAEVQNVSLSLATAAFGTHDEQNNALHGYSKGFPVIVYAGFADGTVIECAALCKWKDADNFKITHSADAVQLSKPQYQEAGGIKTIESVYCGDVRDEFKVCVCTSSGNVLLFTRQFHDAEPEMGDYTFVSVAKAPNSDEASCLCTSSYSVYTGPGKITSACFDSEEALNVWCWDHHVRTLYVWNLATGQSMLHKAGNGVPKVYGASVLGTLSKWYLARTFPFGTAKKEIEYFGSIAKKCRVSIFVCPKHNTSVSDSKIPLSVKLTLDMFSCHVYQKNYHEGDRQMKIPIVDSKSWEKSYFPHAVDPQYQVKRPRGLDPTLWLSDGTKLIATYTLTDIGCSEDTFPGGYCSILPKGISELDWSNSEAATLSPYAAICDLNNTATYLVPKTGTRALPYYELQLLTDEDCLTLFNFDDKYKVRQLLLNSHRIVQGNIFEYVKDRGYKHADGNVSEFLSQTDITKNTMCEGREYGAFPASSPPSALLSEVRVSFFTTSSRMLTSTISASGLASELYTKFRGSFYPDTKVLRSGKRAYLKATDNMIRDLKLTERELEQRKIVFVPRLASADVLQITRKHHNDQWIIYYEELMRAPNENALVRPYTATLSGMSTPTTMHIQGCYVPSIRYESVLANVLGAVASVIRDKKYSRPVSEDDIFAKATAPGLTPGAVLGRACVNQALFESASNDYGQRFKDRQALAHITDERTQAIYTLARMWIAPNDASASASAAETEGLRFTLT